MCYLIKNKKGVYIKLNENGKAVTCPEHEKGIFEYEKAANILKSLKKTLQRLNFYIEPVLDSPMSSNEEQTDINIIVQHTDTQSKEEIGSAKRKVIETQNYELPETIAVWMEKFGTCSDIFDEAEQRKGILQKELDETENKMMDILHEIELQPSKDLYGGWLLYKQVRENRKKRREMKDELLILQDILEGVDMACISRKRMKKSVKGLSARKYTYRATGEEMKEENDM